MLRGGGVALTGAGAGLLFGCGDDGVGGLDGELETTTLRFPKNDGSPCLGPFYVAHQFLLEEGFKDIQYPEYLAAEMTPAVSDGALDFNCEFAQSAGTYIDSGYKFSILAGLHPTCHEVFAREGIDSIGDLKGRRVGVTLGDSATASDYGFMSAILQSVGIPSQHTLVEVAGKDIPPLMLKGELDAAIVIPPINEELRDAGINRVILNGMHDPPWSHYFCCMIVANQTFVKKNPVATKRVLRAILKATDLSAADPEGAARYLFDNGHTYNYEHTLRTMKHMPYDVWRRFDPEDTLRFYQLRLREGAGSKLTPDDLIKKTADWRFLNELKREMPAAFRPILPRTTGFALDCQVGPVETTEAVAAPRPATES